VSLERVIVSDADDVPARDINDRPVDAAQHLPCSTCGAKWFIQVNDGRFAGGSQVHAAWCEPTRRERRRQELELAAVITRTLPIPKEYA
jgi:hypothetical protein